MYLWRGRWNSSTVSNTCSFGTYQKKKRENALYLEPSRNREIISSLRVILREREEQRSLDWWWCHRSYVRLMKNLCRTTKSIWTGPNESNSFKRTRYTLKRNEKSKDFFQKSWRQCTGVESFLLSGIHTLTKPTLCFQKYGPGVLDFLANYSFKPANDCFFDALKSNYASHHIFKRTHQTTWKSGYSIIVSNSVYKSTEA